MDLSQKQRDWLLGSLRGKLLARTGNKPLRLCLERAFRKFDSNDSGELDMEEFRLAMEEHLPGIDESEFVALAREFDADRDGTVSIKEFVERLLEIEELPPTSRHDNGSRSSVRRPETGGIALRRAAEFVDDGYNQPGDLSGDFDEFLDMLRSRVEAMAPRGAGDKLLQRALDRHRATPKARHLTKDQFKTALDYFGEERDTGVEERLWKKSKSGDVEAFMALYQLAKEVGVIPRGEQRQEESPTQRLTKQQLRTLRVKHLLLDKIEDRGGSKSSFRMRVKRLLEKYDKDDSGELDREECERAFLDLLPGVEQSLLKDLVDDLDEDRSGTVSVGEMARALTRAQSSRTPDNTSIHLPRKQPLWTKSGARGQ